MAIVCNFLGTAFWLVLSLKPILKIFRHLLYILLLFVNCRNDYKINIRPPLKPLILLFSDHIFINF